MHIAMAEPFQPVLCHGKHALEKRPHHFVVRNVRRDTGGAAVNRERRIGANQVHRFLGAYQLLECFASHCVGAVQAVAGELPHIAKPGYRILCDLAEVVLAFLTAGAVRVAGFRPGGFHNRLGLVHSKAGKFERVAGGVELLKFYRERVVVPAGQLGQPIVGDDIGALFYRVQVSEIDRWHAVDAEFDTGGLPAVACQNQRRAVAVVAHQHRRRPAKLLNAGGDFVYLLLAVRPGVARVRYQRCEFAVDDFQLGQVGGWCRRFFVGRYFVRPVVQVGGFGCVCGHHGSGGITQPAFLSGCRVQNVPQQLETVTVSHETGTLSDRSD